MRTLTLTLTLLLASCSAAPDDPEPHPCDDAGGDADADGVCDDDDVCLGFDDAADADADGTPDGCDACPTDALDDRDGDGACDSADPCPDDAQDDRDGDGVCDSDDPCPDDVDDDTDGDGVCDSDDQCPDFDDSLDEDADGQPDACDACPVDPQDDRDGDGACDSDDPCPDDVGDDTDGDGVCDSWDICPGLDDDLDADLDGVPDGCVCTVLDVPAPVGPANIPGGVGFGFGLAAIIDQGQPVDYGDPGATSALFRVAVHDGTNFICSIWWDLSAPGVATPSANAWTTMAPVTLFEAWELDLSNGETDCSDPAAELTKANFESQDLGIGIGPMDSLDDLLKQDPAVAAAWDLDWEPYVTSLYLHVPGAGGAQTVPLEVSYVLQYDRTCESLKRDPHTLERIQLPKPTTGPLLEFYEAVPVPVL